jgi:hypothetical protein
MVRSKGLLPVAIAVAVLGAVVLGQGVSTSPAPAPAGNSSGVPGGVVIDCDSLMAELPNCTDMVYTVCSSSTGRPPTCGTDIIAAPTSEQARAGTTTTTTTYSTATSATSATSSSSSSSSSSGAIIESPCDRYVCFDNGTYASMEDDNDPLRSVEDDDTTNHVNNNGTAGAPSGGADGEGGGSGTAGTDTGAGGTSGASKLSWIGASDRVPAAAAAAAAVALSLAV